MLKIFTSALAMLLLACDRGSIQSTKNEIEKTASTEIRVAVLGGETGGAFVDGLRSNGVVNAQASAETDVAERAKLLKTAEVAVILVDATQGPLPITREDVLLCRQFCRGQVIVAFSRSALIDDPELLELEQLEMRDLLESYELPGSTATVCFDSEAARTKLPKGFRAIAAILSQLAPLGQAQVSEPVQSFEASIYALADLECFKKGLAMPIDRGTYRIVFGHRAVDAEIETPGAIQPASSGSVSIRMSEPLELPSNERFVISRQGHVIAAGVVAQLKRLTIR